MRNSIVKTEVIRTNRYECYGAEVKRVGAFVSAPSAYCCIFHASHASNIYNG